MTTKEKLKEYHKEWYQRPGIKDRVNAQHRERRKTPEGIRYQADLNLRRRYGISLETKISMLTNQDYRCLICSTEIDIYHSCVDHNHITKEIRGILCDKCNRMLGLIERDGVRIETIKSYLNSIKKETVYIVDSGF